MVALSAISEDAWAEFESRLQSYIRRRVAADAADDIVGDVLLRLVQHREKLEGADSPIAWMLRAASNAVADHYRKRAAEERALAQAAYEPADEEDPETATANAEIAACLAPFIQGLQEPYREALTLVDIEGLSQTAAAERLGISVSGMKSRVQRGRAKLKESLDRCCAFQLDRRGTVIDYKMRGSGCNRDC